MKLLQKLLIVCVFALSVASCSDEQQIASGKNTIAERVISPTTAQAVIDPEDARFSRVSDLGLIAYALEKYKIKYRVYPISSEAGQGWDGLYSDYGLSKVDWIEGLVPEFLPSLPRDPRMLTYGSLHYLYRSNGAHYKLISHSPDDCEEVFKVYSQIVDPVRHCWAYGYWTPEAARW
jgi:hypothetical protein